MKMVRKPSAKDGWYEISPGEAQQILDKKCPNRKLIERRATVLAGVIKDGQFAENGESTIFDEHDNLIDGQHRMRACVLASKPIVTYCVFGIPRRYFPTIDDGAKRTAGEVAAIAGHKNAMVLAGAARWLFRYEASEGGSIGGVMPLGIQNKQIMDIVRRHPDLTKSVDFVASVDGLFKILSPSIAAFGHYMAAKTDKDLADLFFTEIGTGEGLKSGNPTLALRNKFIATMGDRHKIRPLEAVAIVIKAWNGYIGKKPMRIARYSGKNANETFPRFGQSGHAAA